MKTNTHLTKLAVLFKKRGMIKESGIVEDLLHTYSNSDSAAVECPICNDDNLDPECALCEGKGKISSDVGHDDEDLRIIEELNKER